MSKSERVKAGMEAARARGRRIGRPPALSASQARRVPSLVRRLGIGGAADELGVSRDTIRNYLRRTKQS